MIKQSLIVSLFVISGPLLAQPTNHSSIHVALEQAVNAVLPCPHGVDIVMTGQYTHDSGTISQMVLTAKYIQRDCEEPTPPQPEPPIVDLESIDLSWTAPSARENGDDLPPGEIAGYEISLSNGIATSIILIPGTETSTTINDLQPGRYLLSIIAIDTDGLKSAPSGLVEANL